MWSASLLEKVTCPLSRRKAPWEHLKKAGETANAKALSGNEFAHLRSTKKARVAGAQGHNPHLERGRRKGARRDIGVIK